MSQNMVITLNMIFESKHGQAYGKKCSDILKP